MLDMPVVLHTTAGGGVTTENIAEPSHRFGAAFAATPDESRAMRVSFSGIAKNN
jgi:hypothetical protein